MTTEEMTRLAQDMLDGKVWMTQDATVAEHAFGTILFLMSHEDRQQLIDSRPQVFYEYLDKAHNELNGYPQFFSLHWIDADEWQSFYPIYEVKRKEREALIQQLRDAGYSVERRS